MSPVNPDEVARAMLSARWSALVRLDTDLAGLATWDPALLRHPRLLVPIDVQALYVPTGSTEQFVKLPFALTTPDGEPPAPMPVPFAEGEQRLPGVHLHWALPDSLLCGELDEAVEGSRNRLQMPSLPDRWVVLRIVARARGSGVALRGWVIEADTTRVTPLDQWPSTDESTPATGKTLVDEELTGSVGGSLYWTAVYDAGENRFAFHDPLDDLSRGTAFDNQATYVVAGWWSDAGVDPLDTARGKAGFAQRLGELNWRVLGDQGSGAQLQGLATLAATRRESLGLETALRFTTEGDEQSFTRAYEPVFSPLAEEPNRKVVATPPKHLYSTLLHGVIHGVQVSGQRIVADQQPRTTGVGLAFGVQADDCLAALASEEMELEDAEQRRDTERILAAFTGQRIDEIGSADGVIEVEEHEHAAGFESRPGPPEGIERVRVAAEGAPLPAGRTARARDARRREAAKPTRPVDDARILFRQGDRSDLLQEKPIGLREKANVWNRRETDSTEELESREVQRSGPRYHRPLEPIITVRNARRSARHRFDGATSPDGRLLCRWPSQVPICYDGLVDGDELIPRLPGAGVPPEVLTLARSALVLDPYLPRWLAQQAQRQKSVPEDIALRRLQGEVALRFGTDATYAGELRAGDDSDGDSTWAGARVTDQLRRFSIMKGVDADPIGVTAWAQPWVPLWLEWEVELTVTDRLGETALQVIDIEPVDDGWRPESEARTISGRSPLNSGAAKTLAGAIEDWLSAETARDADNAGEADEATEAQLASVADAVESLDVLSASLDSLHDQLLGLPVGEYGVLNPRQGEGESIERPRAVDVPQLFLNGVARLARARIVDAFGRTMDLPVSRTRIARRSTVPGAPRTLRINPRLLRPARWYFRFADPADLTTSSPPASIDQIDPAAMVNPVAGFLLPDHIDEALEFFDTQGRPLGQLMHEPFGNGVEWEIAPGRPGPADAGPLFELDPAQHVLGHMAAAVVAEDARVRDGLEAAADAESALSALLRAIDTTLWTVDSFAGLGTAHVAGLVGRPIAVVRALLRLDIDDDLEELAFDSDADRDAREAAYRALADRALPVRIGELTRSDDGLLGFFVDDDYTRFHVVDKAVRDGALDSGRGRGHLAQKGNTTQIPETRPIGHPYLFAEDEIVIHPGQVVRLTLLMNPAGRVHLTSGLLPRKSLQLVNDWTSPGLARIAPSTRVGPVLIEPGEVRLPKISSFPEEQVWTRRDSPGTWKDDPILAATQTALLPELPAQVQEGYIRIAPTADDGEETS